jgi:hypothetical protein
MHSLALVGIAIALAGCRENDTRARPPPTPPVDSESAGATEVPRVFYLARGGIAYRWSDGEWVVRLNFHVRSRASAPVTVQRAGILIPNMSPEDSEGSFPREATLLPGQEMSGDVAWVSTDEGQAPPSVHISFGSWNQWVAITRVPAPPPPETIITGPVTGTVSLTVDGEGTTWRYPSDRTQMVRIPVTITNEMNIRVRLPPNYVVYSIGNTRASHWSEFTTLPDPIVLAPGQRVSGFATSYFSAEQAMSDEISVRLGAAEEPLATATARVRPGRAPTPRAMATE